MTIETLFGKEEVAGKVRTMKLWQIKAVYEKLTVREEIFRSIFFSYFKIQPITERRRQRIR